jgi:integrase
MALTDLQIKAAKPGAKMFKLSDSGGLQLWVGPDGSKRWRLAYRFVGKQKLLALGVYPAVGLRDAREGRDQAKRLLADGSDPMAAKVEAKAAKGAMATSTFEAVAKELIEKKRREDKAARTLVKIEWLLGLAYPELGSRSVSEISAPEILKALRPIEERGRFETARRLRATIGEVFRFAVATGRAEIDPTWALRGALINRPVSHRAAIINPARFGGLLRAIASYDGAPETRSAMELLALTFVRPGELRSAEWAEFDLDAALWSIPGSKMKMRRPHRVPIAPQALNLIRKLRELSRPGRFLFPSIRSSDRCRSENTINGALRRLGYGKEEMSAHGFRAAASSILNESGIWHADAIERQLAHVDKDDVRRAYARADFWDERVRMMEWWASKCEELRSIPH